jgi:hypothetical protein
VEDVDDVHEEVHPKIAALEVGEFVQEDVTQLGLGEELSSVGRKKDTGAEDAKEAGGIDAAGFDGARVPEGVHAPAGFGQGAEDGGIKQKAVSCETKVQPTVAREKAEQQDGRSGKPGEAAELP